MHLTIFYIKSPIPVADRSKQPQNYKYVSEYVSIVLHLVPIQRYQQL